MMWSGIAWLAGSMLWAAPPVEQYARQQIRYVNQLAEASSGQPLPAQDFKRNAVTAVLGDALATYTITVYRVEYGDMVYFLALNKETAREGGNASEVRAYRVGEDKTSVERTVMNGTTQVTVLEDGSKKTIYQNNRYAASAYSLSTTTPWGAGGSLTTTEFFNTNENVGADTTIKSARHTTFSLPISINVFRAALPDRVRSFFELFRSLHLLSAQLGESLKTCGSRCGDLQQQKLKVDEERESVWNSLTEAQVTEMRPQKPRPPAPAPPPHLPVAPPPQARGLFFGRAGN